MGVPISTVKKQAFLRQIAEGAKKIASTLKDALLAAQAQIYTANFQRGKILISTSGSGQSGSFEIGMAGKEWTQDNVFGLCEELLQLLEMTVEQGTPDAADPDLIDALVAVMRDNMNSGFIPQIGIRQQQGDFSSLNFPANSLR